MPSRTTDRRREDRDEERDYAGHVPSALALGFSYYDADRPKSLRILPHVRERGGIGLIRRGCTMPERLYLELGDAASALAYMRACATLDGTHPEYAGPNLGITCRGAYHKLSSMLMNRGSTTSSSGSGDSMGLDEAVRCFPYADIDDFPRPNTIEYRYFHVAMRELEEYAKIVRGEGGREDDVRATRRLRFLTSAFERLVDFQSRYRGEISELQSFLVGHILERTRSLIDRLEVEGMVVDEL